MNLSTRALYSCIIERTFRFVTNHKETFGEFHSQYAAPNHMYGPDNLSERGDSERGKIFFGSELYRTIFYACETASFARIEMARFYGYRSRG